jgi:hypothetical protein
MILKFYSLNLTRANYKNANGGVGGILFTSRLGLRVAAGIGVEVVFGSNYEKSVTNVFINIFYLKVKYVVLL